MIILDTNIVSEFMTSKPADSVLNWLNNQLPSQLHLTIMSIAEITYGLGVMQEGKRKNILTDSFEIFIKT